MQLPFNCLYSFLSLHQNKNLCLSDKFYFRLLNYQSPMFFG